MFHAEVTVSDIFWPRQSTLFSLRPQDLCRRLQPEVGRGERSEKLSAAPWSDFMCERGERGERCENVGTVPSLYRTGWWFGT